MLLHGACVIFNFIHQIMLQHDITETIRKHVATGEELKTDFVPMQCPMFSDH